jgi:hypothetical protein
MEALGILKKILYYILFVCASTLFAYFFLEAGLYPYANSLAGLSDVNTPLLQGVYLPIIYSALSLAVALITQFFLIRPSSWNEKRLYGWGMVIVFGALLAALLVLLIFYVKHNAPIGEISLIPVAAFASIECGFGIRYLLIAIEACAKENSANPSQN